MLYRPGVLVMLSAVVVDRIYFYFFVRNPSKNNVIVGQGGCATAGKEGGEVQVACVGREGGKEVRRY